MQLQDFLIKAISASNGWAIVIIFTIFVFYYIYKEYAQNMALSKTLDILDNTLKSLLNSIDKNITTLVDKLIN